MNQQTTGGLSSREVEISRQNFGKNVFSSQRKKRLHFVWSLLKEPMTLFLIAACSIYFITGQPDEGVVMFIAILLVAGISVFQEIRSDNALQEIRQLSAAPVLVVRDGKEQEIDSEEVVKGDLVLVSEGRKVPADLQIINSNDCYADESLLTGESVPVRKNHNDNTLYAGTHITGGRAVTLVTAIGNQTRLGKLGISMESQQVEKTPLQIQVNDFVHKMALAGVVAFLFVWFYNYLLLQNILESFMHGLTLAMAVLPEEIPVAVSTFMALGAVRMIRFQVLSRHPQTVEALGSATVLCVDKTGTLTENKMQLEYIVTATDLQEIHIEPEHLSSESKKILETAYLASEPVAFDPMEIELHRLFSEIKLPGNIPHNIIHEYPLSGKFPFMTHIHGDENENFIVASKGSPEGILQNCDLGHNEKDKLLEKAAKLASAGLRVLAVAECPGLTPPWPEDQHQIKWKVLGLIAFLDPPRASSPEVINGFYKAGINVKMITGDFPETALSVANKIRLKHADRFLTGSQIMEMTDSELMESIKQVNVFARVMPEAKVRIIESLKASGEIVAMTGDGVNDGPALRAAHIGIAMGKRGTNMAKEAASLILLDDDLSNMLPALALGRKIYSNLKKAIRYIISIHIPLISIVTLPLILGWKFPNLFSPVHVIFLELVMGPTCSIVYENEPADKGIMQAPPRKSSQTFFTWRELSFSVFQGIMVTTGMMLIIYLSIQAGKDESATRTIVFTSLVAANIFLTLSMRSERDTFVETLGYKNKWMPAILLITLVLLLTFLFLPIARELFQFSQLPLKEYLLPLLIAFCFVAWNDLYKIIARPRHTIYT